MAVTLGAAAVVAVAAGSLLASAVPAAAAAAAAGTAWVSTGGIELNVRSGPSTAHPRVGSIPNRIRLAVVCQTHGELIRGTARRTAMWNRLSSGHYVSDAYVRRHLSRRVPRCVGQGPAVAVVRSDHGPVNIRSGPRTTAARLGTVADGTPLAVRCQVWGQRIVGSAATSSVWLRLGRERYIAAGYLHGGTGAPGLRWCGQDGPTVPALTASSFVARVLRAARASRNQHGIPVAVTVAQAILESGWGRSRLARRDHNYFGIKCFGDPGRIALGCRPYATTECAEGLCVRTTAAFRAYRTPADSFTDHGRFLRRNPRYAAAFDYLDDPDRFAKEIHKAGYATAPTYAAALIGLMRRHNLYRLR